MRMRYNRHGVVGSNCHTFPSVNRPQGDTLLSGSAVPCSNNSCVCCEGNFSPLTMSSCRTDWRGKTLVGEVMDNDGD